MNIASAAKDLLRKTGTFSAIKDLYCSLGGTVYRSEEEWLRRLLGANRHVFFVQIGAHDGKSNDKIYPMARERAWRGVLVEPVRYLFNRLVENYRDTPGIQFENAALAERSGKKRFYRLKETSDTTLPPWYDQIGSFNKEAVLSHRDRIPNIDNLIIQEYVDCISFDQLVSRHQISKIDLILIDTEGYDLNVLRMINFHQFRPKLLIYEHKHLSPEDKAASEALLRSFGYVIHPTGPNNAAVRRRRH